MVGKRLALVVLAAAAAGAGLGAALRPGSGAGPVRPKAVEAVLRAVDRDDRAALASALEEAGPAEGRPSPWREEVTFARLVLAGDAEAVWNFATEGPRAPARARALLWLRGKASSVAEWKRIEARLEADYPASWAKRALPRPDAGKEPGEGR